MHPNRKKSQDVRLENLGGLLSKQLSFSARWIQRWRNVKKTPNILLEQQIAKIFLNLWEHTFLHRSPVCMSSYSPFTEEEWFKKFLRWQCEENVHFSWIRHISMNSRGFWLLHTRRLCLFTFPFVWNVASSLRIMRSTKSSSNRCCTQLFQNSYHCCSQFSIVPWVEIYMAS